MKIQSISVKNFKGIKSLDQEIKGGNVYLIGPNEVNKTSFIDAVWMGLTGKNIPSEPTHNGAKRGSIEIDLGDFIARTKFTKGKPTVFELENKTFEGEGEKFIKAPRTYLQNRIGVLDFDVNDFFNKTDLEKLQYFSKILDADFSGLDADIEEAMDSRKFNKIRLKELNATVQYYDEADAEKELIDIVALSEKIAAEKAKVETWDRIDKGIQDRRKKVNELLEQIKVLEKEISDGGKWLVDPENMALPMEERVALGDKLKNANATNDRIKSAKAAKATDKEIEELEKEIDSDTKTIEELRQKKAAKISESITVKDLVYDVDKEAFLYKGLPFEANQINTASQLIAGMEIGQSLLKDLRILKVDASLIDKKNWDKVLLWAAKKDIELFVEIVDREGSTLQINVE